MKNPVFGCNFWDLFFDFAAPQNVSRRASPPKQQFPDAVMNHETAETCSTEQNEKLFRHSKKPKLAKKGQQDKITPTMKKWTTSADTAFYVFAFITVEILHQIWFITLLISCSDLREISQTMMHQRRVQKWLCLKNEGLSRAQVVLPRLQKPFAEVHGASPFLRVVLHWTVCVHSNPVQESPRFTYSLNQQSIFRRCKQLHVL